MDNWISIEDKLPPKWKCSETGASENVLLAFGGEHYGPENYLTGFHMDGNWFTSGAEELLPTPIGWITLPEPPDDE